ncbi:MFS transporter [Myroides odoratus]|uniref:MFS transporter n=1 Tax=Myroides odoratus TaxID=256 RepID=UPI0039B0C416
MRPTPLPTFKTWVPDYVIRVTIFALLFPALAVFAFYYSNTAETMGHYGIEAGDVQYSVLLMYGALVCFLPLDDRLVKYFSLRKYLLLGVTVNTISYLICALTRDLTIFFVCRFIQGAVCALFCSICLNLLFPRLNSARARVIGYTLFYGTLLVCVPLCAILCSYILQSYSFEFLWYLLILIQIPGTILLLITTNNIHLKPKLPLYQVDWVSYIYFTVIICSIGYIFIYGQKLNYLEHPMIRWLTCLTFLSLLAFIFRQLKLKRPFITLAVFRYRDFCLGILLLMVYYFFKGTTGFAYTYLQTALGVESISLTPIYISNLSGTFLGLLITSRLLLQGTAIKYIVLGGFSLLLLYHIQVYFLFSNQGEQNRFILPFFIQGLSVATLHVPLIIYTAASIPPSISNAVSFLGISFRFLSFSVTIGLTNYFQLFNKSVHYNRTAEYITSTNPFNEQANQHFQQQLLLDGKDVSLGANLATKLYHNHLMQQVSSRASMDYYSWVIWGLIGIILLVLLAKPTKKIITRVSKNFIPY